MPSTPAHPCAPPACPALPPRARRYCDEHAPRHADESRSASARGYGRAWQRARLEFLAAHPLCEDCMAEGRYVRATDVDHVVAHRGDRRLFWDRSNWRALCHSCHSRKTNRKDMHPTREYGRGGAGTHDPTRAWA